MTHTFSITWWGYFIRILLYPAFLRDQDQDQDQEEQTINKKIGFSENRCRIEAQALVAQLTALHRKKCSVNSTLKEYYGIKYTLESVKSTLSVLN